MPPRFSYWTILIDGKATAFRAHLREDLQPTFVQIRRSSPTAEVKWFARGKLWDSPEAAALDAKERRGKPQERRGPEWRPGGQHKDPRGRFKLTRDQKRRTFARRQRTKKNP
jgi:hypothetical protein